MPDWRGWRFETESVVQCFNWCTCFGMVNCHAQASLLSSVIRLGSSQVPLE